MCFPSFVTVATKRRVALYCAHFFLRFFFFFSEDDELDDDESSEEDDFLCEQTGGISSDSLPWRARAPHKVLCAQPGLPSTSCSSCASSSPASASCSSSRTRSQTRALGEEAQGTLSVVSRWLRRSNRFTIRRVSAQGAHVSRRCHRSALALALSPSRTPSAPPATAACSVWVGTGAGAVAGQLVQIAALEGCSFGLSVHPCGTIMGAGVTLEGYTPFVAAERLGLKNIDARTVVQPPLLRNAKKRGDAVCPQLYTDDIRAPMRVTDGAKPRHKAAQGDARGSNFFSLQNLTDGRGFTPLGYRRDSCTVWSCAPGLRISCSPLGGRLRPSIGTGQERPAPRPAHRMARPRSL